MPVILPSISSRRWSPFLRTLLSASLCFLIAACGGGGGDPGPPTTVNDDGPPIRPAPDPSLRGNAELLAKRGDPLAGENFVANIEDAAFAPDGTAAFIATLNGPEELRAIVRRSPDGTRTTLFGPGNAPDGVVLPALSRVRMAPSGEIAFLSGESLDEMKLHLILDDETLTLSGLEGAPISRREARILGSYRIGGNGVVSIVTGGGDCVAEPSGDSIRYECQLAIWVRDANGIQRVEHEEVELGVGRTSVVRLAINPAGDLFFSIPSQRGRPVLLRWTDGAATALLREGEEIDGVGFFRRVTVSAANTAREMLVGVSPPIELEGESVKNRLGILDSAGNYVDVAREGDALDGEETWLLRGVGIADTGSVLFEARSVAAGPINTHAAALWVADELGVHKVVREGERLVGADDGDIVLRITGSRFNAAGDTIFVVEIGDPGDETLRIRDVRAILRRADGTFVRIASSADAIRLGTISDLTITGFLDDGSSLLIAERGSSSDRALLRGGREPFAGD